MIKTLLILCSFFSLFMFSCSADKKASNDTPINKEIVIDSTNTVDTLHASKPKSMGYKNSIEDFTSFCEKFKEKVYENDTTWINKINKSGKKMEDLGLRFFKDTNGLNSRKPAVNEEMGGYEYASSYVYKSNSEDSTTFESGIYYYFSYNEVYESFDLKEVLMAG